MRKPTVPEIPESEVQAVVVEGLTALGYTVLTTSRQRKRCAHCHRYSSGGDGVDRGVPDLLVGRKGWGPMWLGLEMKGTKTNLSPAQAALLADNLICVARSWESATEAVQAFQKRYNLPGPAWGV